MPAVPLAIPLLFLAGFIVAYGALAAYRGQDEEADGSIKGLLLWLADRMAAVKIGVWFASGHPLGFVADALRWVANSIENMLAAVVDFFEAPVAQFLYLLVEIPAQTARSLAAFATATARKLAWIEQTYVPRAIDGAISGPLSAVGALRASFAYMTAHVLPGIRGEVEGLGEVVGRTAKQARAHARRLARLEAALAGGAFAVAVGVALNRLGLRWLRCSSLNRIGRKHGCRPWQLLEMLLAPTVAILALRDMCTIMAMIQRAGRAAEPVLTNLVVTGEGFLCGGEANLASGVVASDRAGSKGYASGVLASDLRG